MKRIGILTAGGDTPALNATIHGAVIRANQLRYENESTGTTITGIILDGRFTQSQFQLNRFTGKAGSAWRGGYGRAFAPLQMPPASSDGAPDDWPNAPSAIRLCIR